MNKNITFDYKKALGFFDESELSNITAEINKAHNFIYDKNGAGNDFLGWVDLPENYDKEEFARIKSAAEKIRKDSDVLIVIGIGGSYLGAKAAVDFLKGPFYNDTAKTKIIFAGNSISPNYINGLLKYCNKDKPFYYEPENFLINYGIDISINVSDLIFRGEN